MHYAENFPFLLSLQCFVTVQMSSKAVQTTVVSVQFMLFAQTIQMAFVAVVVLATKEMAGSV